MEYLSKTLTNNNNDNNPWILQLSDLPRQYHLAESKISESHWNDDWNLERRKRMCAHSHLYGIQYGVKFIR